MEFVNTKLGCVLKIWWLKSWLGIVGPDSLNIMNQFYLPLPFGVLL